MGQMTKDDVISLLVKQGGSRDCAVFYADAYTEYQEASSNIAEHGTIVQHPRTANPVENPYLVIRDRALKKLRALRGIKTDGLW